jgi:hypothetical protein
MTRALLLTALCGLAGACVEDAQLRNLDAETDAARLDATQADAARDAALPDAEADASAPPCDREDDLADNHGRNRAAQVPVGFARSDLYICPDLPDYFEFSLAEAETVTLVLQADPTERDLDLAVLSPSGEVVAESVGELGSERLSFAAPSTGRWLARVSGYRGTAAGYALSIAGGCTRDAQCPPDQVCRRSEATCIDYTPADCGVDRNEPNDRDDQATRIALGTALNGTVCDAERDWFAFDVEEGASVDAAVFNTRGADLDLVAVDVTRGGIMASAQNQADTNPEIVRLTALPAGRYAVGVFAYTGGTGDVPYTFEVAARSEPCRIDRDCANDPYPRCDAGVCRPVNGGGAVALGGRCGALTDCGPEATRCHTGGVGGHDNVCTVSCANDAGCVGLGARAYCLQVEQNLSVCIPGCGSDADCSRFRTCGPRGQCDIRGECTGDRDCETDEVCDVLPFGRYCGQALGAVGCGDDPAPFTANDDAATAPALPLDDTPVTGLRTCDADRDLFALVVPPERAGQSLEINVDFETGPDIDAYLVDAEGRPVAEATTPADNPEVVRASFLPAGRYVLLVDQFSSPRLADNGFSVRARLTAEAPTCNDAPSACANVSGRPDCDAATGACTR